MADLTENEELTIRAYVNGQSPVDDQVDLVQKIGSRRIMGRIHDMYDVHTATTRYWVITDPTNLYLQADFPQVEQALIFHLGMGIFIAEHSRSKMDQGKQEYVPPAWRRFQQALDAMNDASESEDFQAVGIKCRDALIALVRQHKDAPWVGDPGEESPKAADFKGWGNVFAERLAEGRLRNYLKSLVDKTWDLTVWLQHYSNATPIDADIVLDSTSHLISMFGRLIHRLEEGEPDRCPRCKSYRLDEGIDQDDDREGFWEYTVCGACGWRSDPEFTSWAEHFKDADIAGYLSSPGLGVSDRLNRQKRGDRSGIYHSLGAVFSRWRSRRLSR